VTLVGSLRAKPGLRPVYHHREDRIRAHVQLCWLALLLMRVAVTRTGDTWRNLLGADHPHTLVSRSNLAGAYRSPGRLDEAIPLTITDLAELFNISRPTVYAPSQLWKLLPHNAAADSASFTLVLADRPPNAKGPDSFRY
jgi:hypothetical protein